MDAARRLLRETKKSVIAIAEVGYSNPSHFAKLFRKEGDISSTDYRRRQYNGEARQISARRHLWALGLVSLIV
jgi:AraC-like DNA-binding protein